MKRNKSDPFYSPKHRLARAKTHIDRFSRRVDTYFKKAPRTHVIEPDPDGIHQVHSLRIGKDLPEVCVSIATEAMEGLRAVLDQCGYAASVASGKIGPKQTYFPFADDIGGLATVVKGRCKDLPEEVTALFVSFKPYQGGNDALWALNKMRQGIHTTLVPFGVATGGMHIKHLNASGGVQVLNPVWDRDKNQIAYLKTMPGAKLDYNIGFALNVALGDIDVLKNVPAIDALRAMHGQVRKVLIETEATSRRIGHIK